MDQCMAIKKDGLQCTRNKAPGQKHYCTQHSKSTTTTHIKEIEPWVTLKLPEPDKRNEARYIQAIRTHLKKTHTFKKNTPTGGFIYIFSLPSEKGSNYWKIGFTTRTVEERLEEWASKRPLTLYKSYEIRYNAQKTEALIHLYLAYCRVYRYSTEQGFHTVHKLTGKVLEDGGEKRPSAKSKEIEWFQAPIDEILRVVEPICAKQKK